MSEVIPNWHPLLVHFPVALISVSAFFHLATLAIWGRHKSAVHCAVLAHATLWMGALAAVLAAMLGWLAFSTVDHDEAGHAAMQIHRAWALGTLAVLMILAGWDFWHRKIEEKPEWWFAGMVVAAWALVATTAWYGGELVYRHGLGVMATSITASEAGHQHHHEDADHEH